MTTTAILPWGGSSLGAGYVSLVVGTAGATSPGAAPAPVAPAAASHGGAWLVPPARLGDFLRAHAAAHLVCHDAGELHRILWQHLGRAGDQAAKQILWQLAAAGRLYDVTLLDQLVRLAEVGANRPPRLPLEGVASAYCPGQPLLAAADVCRLAASIPTDPTLAAEATLRAEVVLRVYEALWQRLPAAVQTSAAAGSLGPFSLLSLTLQVKADIALTHARYNGLHLAPGSFATILANCRKAQDAAGQRLLADRSASQWLKTDQKKQIKYTKNGLAQKQRTKLKAWLRAKFDAVKGLHLTDLTPPRGQDGELSLDPDAWGQLTRCDPLLQAWADLETAPALARSLPAAPALHSRYDILPQARAREPDLETLRRLGGPGHFRPAPGHRFLVVFLAELELRALAAVCQYRFGHSRLANVFLQDRTPTTSRPRRWPG